MSYSFNFLPFNWKQGNTKFNFTPQICFQTWVLHPLWTVFPREKDLRELKSQSEEKISESVLKIWWDFTIMKLFFKDFKHSDWSLHQWLRLSADIGVENWPEDHRYGPGEGRQGGHHCRHKLWRNRNLHRAVQNISRECWTTQRKCCLGEREISSSEVTTKKLFIKN